MASPTRMIITNSDDHHQLAWHRQLGWHHQLDRHEFEQAPGVGDEQEAWHAAVHGVTKSGMTE